LGKRTTVIKCKGCETIYHYKDFQTIDAHAICGCQNIEILCEKQENSRHEFFIMVIYRKERPDVFEADERRLRRRAPFK